MASDTSTGSLLDLIAKLSPDDIENELNNNRIAQRRLIAEEELLKLALQIVRGSVVVERDIETSTPVDDVLTDSDTGNFQIKHRKQSRGSREAVLQLMRDTPNRNWTATAVFQGLQQRNVETTMASVRMMLQRLHADGVLERPKQGRYRLPITDTENGGDASRSF
jgi:hypothetical protein